MVKLDYNKLTILSESYDIEESPTTGKSGDVKESAGKVYLVGKALTFNSPTRNKVSYTYESGLATLKTWEGKPFLNSHKDDDVLSTFGHLEKMEIKPDEKGRQSMYYKVDLDPEEKEFIHKAKRHDIPYVSVQVLVSDVRQKESLEFGNYIEADIKEGLELSSVSIPGEREASGYITEERFAESFLGKEQFPDPVMDIKKDRKPLIKKGDPEHPNQAIVPAKATVAEDITTDSGGALIAKGLAKKIKKAPEPDNKITPDLIPRRMISMQSLDKDHEKKTNMADEEQKDQEVGFSFDGKMLKYWRKGGNNIPGVPLKGYKAESLSTVVNCCGKPMIVAKNKVGNTALCCSKCGRGIVKSEDFWKKTNTYLKEKLKK